MIRSIAFLLVLALVATPSAAAQGTLSTQGFGYPPGEFSTRAGATGGALAEVDPLSPLNPATLTDWGRPGFYLQYSPEFRSVESPTGDDGTTTSRFPVIMATLPIGSRLVLGLSASTLLDRTWEVLETGFDSIAPGDSVAFTRVFRAEGGVTDLRLGVGYAITPRLRVGVGGHVFTGENRLAVTQQFTDSGFAGFDERSVLGFSGTGVSLGVEWTPVSALTLGVSGRAGGRLETSRNDTTLSQADVPVRVGGSLAFGGIAGVVIAANVEWYEWSTLQELTASDAPVSDALDVGVGAEVRGPDLLGVALPLRVGYRHRTLPFTVNGAEVTENLYSVGTAIPLAGGRSRIDLGLARALRDADVEADESAWIVSVGLIVRP